MYTVGQNKRHPFYFCDIFVRFHPIFANFWLKHTPENLKQAHIHGTISISFYMFALYLVKTNDASGRTLRRRPLLLRLVFEPERRTFFKSLFKLLTFQPLSENLRINFLRPKALNLCKFSIKMRTLASPNWCVIWSGLHQSVIGEAIDLAYDLKIVAKLYTVQYQWWNEICICVCF